MIFSTGKPKFSFSKGMFRKTHQIIFGPGFSAQSKKSAEIIRGLLTEY